MSDYYGPTKNDSVSISKWLLLFFALLLLAAVLYFGYSWVTKPLEVMSPDNIERLSKQANEQWEALQAQLANINAAQQSAEDLVNLYGEDKSSWPQGKGDEYLQFKQQARNFITAYNASCATYNALWQDEWRSVPAPDDMSTSCDLYTE